GLEPSATTLFPLLASSDRWVRFAARVALERVPTEKWKAPILAHADASVQLNGLLGLYRLGSESLSTGESFAAVERLFGRSLSGSVPLDLRRFLELVLIHDKTDNPETAALKAKLGGALVREFSQALAGGEKATATPIVRTTAELIAWLNVPGAIDAL